MKLPRRNFLHLLAGAAALPAISRIARAQAYPSRPVRIVVGFPAWRQSRHDRAPHGPMAVGAAWPAICHREPTGCWYQIGATPEGKKELVGPEWEPGDERDRRVEPLRRARFDRSAARGVAGRGERTAVGDAGDRIPERPPPSVTAHATTDLSTPWPSFDAALIRGLTVISTW
jgi:hypothetical protein